jgi:proteic killer suppression protein
MEITFATAKLAKLCNSEVALIRTYGVRCATRIRLRLQQLEAVSTLADMVFDRPHELKGDRAGQVSLDLVHPLRLVICPDANPVPRKPDGGIDRTKVDTVTVIEITDTHE